jgi:hypothetical protein
MNTPLPIRRRNAMLWTAAALLVLAMIQHPSLFIYLFSVSGWIRIALVAFAGIYSCLEFNQIANQILKNNGLPWYTRPGGFGVLMVLVVGLCLLLGFVDFLMITLGLPTLISQKALVFLFFSEICLWTVLSEWIHIK